MSIKDIIEGKKEWRAHVARVKALPNDYQIVYHELQKYLYKVGPVDTAEGMSLLSGVVDLFEQGAADGKVVLEVTGRDVAAFADALLDGCQTYADLIQATVDQKVAKAIDKSMK